MTTLVTGSAGFIGTHLVGFLHDSQHVSPLCGFDWATDAQSDSQPQPGVKLVTGDIRDRDAVDSLMQQLKPQRIYHLAAQSFPTLSWKEPVLTSQTNIIGTIHLFEAILKYKLESRILVACSSAEYGYTPEDKMPLTEEHPLKPLHPYGISKVAQDLLAYQYFVNFGVPAVRVRIFNTTGPGKTGDVCSDFVRRIVQIEKGFSPPVLKVGNIDTRRDIMDVRDCVRGLHLALETGEAGQVYNICGGRIFRISELLDSMLEMAVVKNIRVECDESLLRPSDEPIILGDNSKLYQQTGWQPEIPIEQTIQDMFQYWRASSSGN